MPPLNLPIKLEEDLVHMRRLVRALAIEAGFSIVGQTKLVTAASELGRNMLLYAGGGAVEGGTVSDGPRTGVKLVFTDRGPGIADLALAMTDGYTSGTGLGLGLSGSKRLMSEFKVDTVPGKGTAVTISLWR